jgi:predicted negative regulator of RcsB-dependent stress response
MDQYRKALRSDSRNRNAMIGLARLQHRTGDMQGAIQVYRKALESYRNDPVILNDLGLCYARNGQLDQAISILRTATQAAPDREMYRNNLAAALVEAKRADEAVAHLTQTYGAAVANYNVGYLLSQGGEADTARAYLEKAAQLDPSMQQARNLLNENVQRVSSLPPRAHTTGNTHEYRPPVTRERETELTLPQHLRRPPGNNEPLQPADSPTYLQQKPTRFGPFGYVPAGAPEAMVVSYSEPLEAPEPPELTPAYPRLQPVYPVALPLRLPERDHWSGQGDLVPPTP